MTTPEASPQKTKHPEKHQELKKKLMIDGSIFAALVLLSTIGIGVTNFTPTYGLWYWIAMAPIFALACIFFQWIRTSADSQSRTTLIRNQVLHWVGLLLAMHLVFLLHSTGRMNNADTGLIALLVLAVATFLAGIYTDWRFCLVGILLGGAVAGAAYVQEYFWIMLIPVTIAFIGGGLWVNHYIRRLRSS